MKHKPAAWVANAEPLNSINLMKKDLTSGFVLVSLTLTLLESDVERPAFKTSRDTAGGFLSVEVEQTLAHF